MNNERRGEIYGKVMELCHQNLLKDDKTMQYLLKNRCMTEESINRFQLGLFPQDLRQLFKIEDPKDLREADIINTSSYSRFKTQDLVMPVRDVYGNFIAIAGRTRLSEEERQKRRIDKYKNSIYKKSHHLFGLNFAKRSILREDKVYVVEGYFDVITPQQNGLTNVVAVCGTYLSTRHAVLLSRYTKNIVLVFDNEEDAQQRAKATIDKKQFNGISISAINPFPNGVKDIDDYFRDYPASDVIRSLKKGKSGDLFESWINKSEP